MKKILYLECKTGAAGDMLMGALYSLLTEEQKVLFLEKLNAISEDVRVCPQEICKQGIGGIHMKVEINGTEEGTEVHHHHEHDHHEEEHGHTHDHEHHHAHEHEYAEEHVHTHEEMHIHSHEEGHTHDHEHAHSHAHGHHSHTSVAAILEQISKLDMSDTVKKDAEGIYREIAAAESKVHQTDMEQIHFHEVGSVDALIDVVGSCLALELLGVDEVQASPVCVGNGTVRCAHGILPVPAPATAEIIKGMPVYCSSFDGELLTPTGAAILKYFVETYTKEMHMEIEEIGYGFGTKDFAQLSCVRAFLGYQK
ncbi:LarC family nickel insertion protein [uncultured Eubacterium sp.]|uniref:LarC family nickel insertion protein n=1 Tax=uncultured Eubacterium sp. TaxID=165185 RepID=UPI002591DF87|nr:LarC family nickel insertion protein [uncultured Eubacterium sp.]